MEIYRVKKVNIYFLVFFEYFFRFLADYIYYIYEYFYWLIVISALYLTVLYKKRSLHLKIS